MVVAGTLATSDPGSVVSTVPPAWRTRTATSSRPSPGKVDLDPVVLEHPEPFWRGRARQLDQVVRRAAGLRRDLDRLLRPGRVLERERGPRDLDRLLG